MFVWKQNIDVTSETEMNIATACLNFLKCNKKKLTPLLFQGSEYTLHWDLDAYIPNFKKKGIH